jgi:cytochrome c2
MKTALKIFAFAILVSAFYSYVGHMVPQKITYPPESVEISADLTTEEMVDVGASIVSGKGTCLGCHTIGDASTSLRFPDLANIGSRAATRVDGMTDVAYLAQSLYDPNAYLVEGFNAGMPPVGKPPISLTDEEVLTVIAYLQSLGGTPSVTLATVVDGQGESTAAPAGGGAVAAAGPALDGAGVYASYLCATCHAIDDATQGVGPSLFDVGSRLSKAQIYESIMEPDAVLADGFSAGLMPATLGAVGFYDKVTSTELKALVDFLATHEGN